MRVLPAQALDVAYSLLPILSDAAREADERAAFPTAPVTALRRSGMLGLLVPAEYGGMGGTLADLKDVAKVLATGCTSTAMIWAMHCQQVDTLVRFGSADLLSSLLPRIASGECYLGSVTTEPGSGGHLLRSDSPATADGNGIEIVRDAPVVTGGRYADGFLITMRESPDAPKNRVSLVYADRKDLTIEVAGSWDPLGMRATCSGALRLAGRIPRGQVVGAAGNFREVAVESLIPAGHVAWAACWLGTAAGALRDVITAYRSPDNNLRFDASSDLAAERIARVRMDIDVVDALLDSVVERIMRTRSCAGSLSDAASQIAINNLKVVAAERAFRAVDRLVQIAGLSNGYQRQSPLLLERHLRDLRSASLNYADDRLLSVTGRLVLLDRAGVLPADPGRAAATGLPAHQPGSLLQTKER